MNTYLNYCGQCGTEAQVCRNCHSCEDHCACPARGDQFDQDELGLDPETDNTPGDATRHA